jgi:hypothetical protein
MIIELARFAILGSMLASLIYAWASVLLLVMPT